MAKLNEGDVIEGIFTIALSLYLADGKVDKRKLNTIRTQIDTKMFNTGRFSYVVAKNVRRQTKGKPPDVFNVSFEMRLKPESIPGAFGKDYNVLFKSSKDVGKIDKKIDQIIKSVETTNFAKKADAAIRDFLNNKYGEIVDFVVVADGIAGESSGGEIKGDVMMNIYVKRKGSTKKLTWGSIPFSLKSESVTVANLSPYNGMLDIAAAMDIKWDARTKYARLAKPFNGPIEQKAKFKLIESMYTDLKKEVVKKSKDTAFTRTAMKFLRKSIFGSDLADVVDIRTGTIKEITVEYFDHLMKTTTLEVEARGNNLVFVDKKTKAPIFQIRTKLRESANEAKFYLEVGTGIYASH